MKSTGPLSDCSLLPELEYFLELNESWIKGQVRLLVAEIFFRHEKNLPDRLLLSFQEAIYQKNRNRITLLLLGTEDHFGTFEVKKDQIAIILTQSLEEEIEEMKN